MQRALVVCTWSGGEDFTTLCLKTLPETYPIVVIINDANNASQDWVDRLQKSYHVVPIFANGYELGAIDFVHKQTQIEEFWLIQHTIEVLDPTVFDIGFRYINQSISYSYNQFENYLGKYIRTTLDKTFIPEAKSKWAALYYESEFHLSYAKHESIYCIDETFYSDSPLNYIEEIFGEKRFVEVGKFLRKRRSITRESFNIPTSWSDDQYQSFIKYWEGKK